MVIEADGSVAINPDLAVAAFYDDCDPVEAADSIRRLRPQVMEPFPVLSEEPAWSPQRTLPAAQPPLAVLRTSEQSLSRVKSIAKKLVRQLRPEMSSHFSLIFRNAWSSSFCRSARQNS